MTKRELKRRLKEIRGSRQQLEVSRDLGIHPSMWSRAEKYGIVGPALKLALLREKGIDLDAE